MHRSLFFLAAALVLSAALRAQSPPSALPLQQIQQIETDFFNRVVGSIMPALRSEPGRPFSATVTSQTTQTFPDGMHIIQTTTTVEYRDTEGRTRIERTERGPASSQPAKTVHIRDPVTRVNYTLHPARKTALRFPNPDAPITITMQDIEAARAGRSGNLVENAQERTQTQQLRNALGDLADLAQDVRGRRNPINTVEDLGTQNINGVLARGTRITSTVPAGAIGNDREFRSVTERWFSPDLNILVKSVNTDPRFGTTTYELTNISREPPDPSLFRVPSDYTISGVPN